MLVVTWKKRIIPRTESFMQLTLHIVDYIVCHFNCLFCNCASSKKTKVKLASACLCFPEEPVVIWSIDAVVFQSMDAQMYPNSWNAREEQSHFFRSYNQSRSCESSRVTVTSPLHAIATSWKGDCVSLTVSNWKFTFYLETSCQNLQSSVFHRQNAETQNKTVSYIETDTFGVFRFPVNIVYC